MVIGVVNTAVLAEDQAFCATIAAGVIDIAFRIRPVREQALPVAEAVTADAHSGGNVPEIPGAAVPAKLLSFLLGEVVLGKRAEGVDVLGNVLRRGVGAILFDRCREGLIRGELVRDGSCRFCGRCGIRFLLSLDFGLTLRFGLGFQFRQGFRGGAVTSVVASSVMMLGIDWELSFTS